jgi:hypothetical protein
VTLRSALALILCGTALNLFTPVMSGAGFFDPQTSTSDNLGPDWQKITGGMGYQGCLVVSTNLSIGCMGNGTINADAIYVGGVPVSGSLPSLPKCVSPCAVPPVAAGQPYVNLSGFVVIAQP